MRALNDDQLVGARELAFAAPDRDRGAARTTPDGSDLDPLELLLSQVDAIPPLLDEIESLLVDDPGDERGAR